MATGLGLLRLSPKDFWSMTPREFERAVSALRPTRTDPMCGLELSELMRRFPDEGDLAWPKT
ncbi:phage tail assembly chaperone [Mesorhizobium sp. NBSH29]|nr:phage tail assembly chaperone [Mesorhizobium sp. NBSH29]